MLASPLFRFRHGVMLYYTSMRKGTKLMLLAVKYFILAHVIYFMVAVKHCSFLI